jgi:hypothetical protein
MKDIIVKILREQEENKFQLVRSDGDEEESDYKLNISWRDIKLILYVLQDVMGLTQSQPEGLESYLLRDLYIELDKMGLNQEDIENMVGLMMFNNIYKVRNAYINKNVKNLFLGPIYYDEIVYYPEDADYDNEQVEDECARCYGTGQTEGECKKCDGYGKIDVVDPETGEEIEDECGECWGSGEVSDAVCPECKGSGEYHYYQDFYKLVPIEVTVFSKKEFQRDGIEGKNFSEVYGARKNYLHLDIKNDTYHDTMKSTNHNEIKEYEDKILSQNIDSVYEPGHENMKYLLGIT